MGQDLPSVTQIISAHSDFSKVPPDVLEAACARGTEVHRLCANYAKGLWIDEVDPEHEGYFTSFKNWFDEFVAEVVLVEEELVDPVYEFIGHPDLIVRIVGDPPGWLTLPDLKTPKPLSKTWRLQVAGYKRLADANGYQTVRRVASLRLAQDGGLAKFQGYTRTLHADVNVFLSEFNVWRFFNA